MHSRVRLTLRTRAWDSMATAAMVLHGRCDASLAWSAFIEAAVIHKSCPDTWILPLPISQSTGQVTPPPPTGKERFLNLAPRRQHCRETASFWLTTTWVREYFHAKRDRADSGRLVCWSSSSIFKQFPSGFYAIRDLSPSLTSKYCQNIANTRDYSIATLHCEQRVQHFMIP